MSPLHRAMLPSRGLLHPGPGDCAVIGSITLHEGMQEVMSMLVKATSKLRATQLPLPGITSCSQASTPYRKVAKRILMVSM